MRPTTKLTEVKLKKYKNKEKNVEADLGEEEDNLLKEGALWTDKEIMKLCDSNT